MTRFSQISAGDQAALLTAVFVTMLAAVYLLCVSAADRKNRRNTAFVAALFAVLFILAETLCEEVGVEVSGGFPVPVWALWCFTAGAAVWIAARAVKWHRYTADNISLFSIKHAMDSIPAAVCYFSSSGEIKLCNPRMYSLYRDIAKSDLQTLAEFDEALERCETAGIVRIGGDENTFIFPNGSVWHYSRSVITADSEAYTEVLFTDITELYEKRQELKRQSAQLKEVYADIKRLSENVLELTREKEILTAKTRLHDQMGVGIAAVRQILLQNHTTEENAAALELWRKAVSVIKSDNENAPAGCGTADILQDAAAVGIRVNITGEIPAEGQTGRLLLLALRESLSNAARHAEAAELNVLCEKTADAVTLRITNDGKLPTGDVKPRGGLKNLAGMLAECGGSMAIKTAPEFSLTVTVPADLEEKL